MPNPWLEKILKNNDREAGRSAKLVALEHLYFFGKKIAGIQTVIAQELKKRAVEFIGSRFDRDVDHGAAPAVFGRKTISLNFEFLNSINRGSQGNALEELLGIADAVQQPFCL